MKLWKGDEPKLGKSYSVTTGAHVGKIFIFIKKDESDYYFLSVPDMVNHMVSKKDFDIGLKNGILEYLEKVPGYVRRTTKAQFEENEKSQEMD